MFIKVQDNNRFIVINTNDIKIVTKDNNKFRSFGFGGEVIEQLKRLSKEDLLEVYNVALAYALNYNGTDIYDSAITSIDFLVDKLMVEHGEEYADILGM